MWDTPKNCKRLVAAFGMGTSAPKVRSVGVESLRKFSCIAKRESIGDFSTYVAGFFVNAAGTDFDYVRFALAKGVQQELINNHDYGNHQQSRC